VGIIASVSRPFCLSCNRLRLTAEGKLRNCLFALTEVDVKPYLRDRPDDAALAEAIAPTFPTSGRGTISTRRGSSNRCAPCTPSAVDAEKKWRRTQNKRYPNGRRFLSTRGRGWPGPIRGGRPMRHALRTAVLALAVLTLGTAPARAVDQVK